MNSRERILTAIRLKEPDRVPCSPFVTPSTLNKMSKNDRDVLISSTDVTMAVGCLSDIHIFGGRYLAERSTTIQEGDVFIHRIETPKGILAERRVVTSTTTWISEHYFRDRKDIEKLFSIPYEPLAFDVESYREWTELIGNEGLVMLGIPSAIRFCLIFFGPETLYLMMADSPELVENLIAVMNERLAGYVEECCRKGVRNFWMGGAEHCGPGVVHPRMFARMVTPYDKKIVSIIHTYNGMVNYHIHGKLRDILDEIAEIGVDVMSPIESGLRGDVTLREVKEKLGNRICLKGNLDDMAFLASASEEEVRAAAEDCIKQAGEGGGYLLSGTDAGIASPVWVRNFLVMADVAKKHTY